MGGSERRKAPRSAGQVWACSRWDAAHGQPAGFEAARDPAHGCLATCLVCGVQLHYDVLVKVRGDASGRVPEEARRLAASGQFPDRLDPAAGEEVTDGLFLALRDGLLFRGGIARSGFWQFDEVREQPCQILGGVAALESAQLLLDPVHAVSRQRPRGVREPAVVAHQGPQRAGHCGAVRVLECGWVEAAQAVQDQVVLRLGQVGQPGDQVRPARAGQPGIFQQPVGDHFGVPEPSGHARLRRLVVEVPLAPSRLV